MRLIVGIVVLMLLAPPVQAETLEETLAEAYRALAAGDVERAEALYSEALQRQADLQVQLAELGRLLAAKRIAARDHAALESSVPQFPSAHRQLEELLAGFSHTKLKLLLDTVSIRQTKGRATLYVQEFDAAARMQEAFQDHELLEVKASTLKEVGDRHKAETSFEFIVDLQWVTREATGSKVVSREAADDDLMRAVITELSTGKDGLRYHVNHIEAPRPADSGQGYSNERVTFFLQKKDRPAGLEAVRSFLRSSEQTIAGLRTESLTLTRSTVDAEKWNGRMTLLRHVAD